MTYSVGQVRNWEVGALIEAGDAVSGRVSVAQDAQSILSDGGEVLDEGWDGLAADVVLDAVELEGHMSPSWPSRSMISSMCSAERRPPWVRRSGPSANGLPRLKEPDSV